MADHHLPLAERRPVAPSPRARRWVIGLASTAAVVLLAGTFFQLLTAIARHEYTVTETWTGADVSAVESARLSNHVGHLEVTGTARDEIRVDVEVTDGLFRARRNEAVVGDQLRTRASCPLWFTTHCRVDQLVTLPADLRTEIDGRHGTVTLTGLAGPVVSDTAFGPLRVAGLAGPTVLRHQFGDLAATGLRSDSLEVRHRFGNTDIEFAEAPTELRVDTQFGTTVIELPDDGAAYRVTGATSFGTRTIDVRTDSESPRHIELDTSFGDAIVRYAR